MVTTPPTTTSTGVRKYTCTKCDKTKEEVIPKLNPQPVITYTELILKAGEGHEELAAKIAEEFNKTAPAGTEDSVTGSYVKLYMNSSLTISGAEDEFEELLNKCGDGVDNGQYCPARVGLKPVDGYEDFDEYWDTERDEDSPEGIKQISDNTAFFMHWLDPVSSLDVLIKDPVCGDEVRLIDGVPDKRPEGSISGKDAGKINSQEGLAIWQAAEQETGVFEGKFVGETQYKAFVTLLTNYGYYIPDDFKVNISGSLVKCEVGQSRMFVMIRTLIKAQHQWDDGVITKEATPTEEGELLYTCAACGKTKTEVIPTVDKYENTLKASGRTVKVKAAKLKEKAVKIARKKAIKVSGAEGKVTYKKIKVLKGKKKAAKKIAKKFVINKKNGRITIKKGVKKGTYRLKVRVRAAGNDSYKAKSKTVTVKIIVK